MQIQFTGHNIDITPAIREHVEKKLHRLKSNADKINTVHIILEVNKLRQIAEANLDIPGLSRINAKAESEDMYKTIDLLVDKLNVQLTRNKDRSAEH